MRAGLTFTVTRSDGTAVAVISGADMTVGTDPAQCSYTIQDLPVASESGTPYTYTVTETDHPDLAGWYCTTTAAAAAGTVQVPSGGVGEAVISNTYAPFLRVTVTKQVTGGMGDTRRGFAFTAAIDGAAVTADTPYVQPYGGAALTADGFTIPHKGSIVIGHLKPGQTVTVTEETLTDYETTMDDGSNVTLGSSYTATLTGDAALTCVNNKDGVPPTGLAQDAAPAVWLLAAGAALASDAYAELIADGFHVDARLFPLMRRAKGERLVLITDCTRAGGMQDGQYTLGGQPIFVHGVECRLADGTIAGSVLRMNDAVRNYCVHGGAPLYQAVHCAALTPARSIGMQVLKGSLEAGKDADILLIDKDVRVHAVWTDGQRRL